MFCKNVIPRCPIIMWYIVKAITNSILFYFPATYFKLTFLFHWRMKYNTLQTPNLSRTELYPNEGLYINFCPSLKRRFTRYLMINETNLYHNNFKMK